MCVECERGVWQHGGRMFKVFVYCLIQEQVSVFLQMCLEMQAEVYAQPGCFTSCVLCMQRRE